MLFSSVMMDIPSLLHHPLIVTMKNVKVLTPSHVAAPLTLRQRCRRQLLQIPRLLQIPLTILLLKFQRLMQSLPKLALMNLGEKVEKKKARPRIALFKASSPICLSQWYGCSCSYRSYHSPLSSILSFFKS